MEFFRKGLPRLEQISGSFSLSWTQLQHVVCSTEFFNLVPRVLSLQQTEQHMTPVLYRNSQELTTISTLELFCALQPTYVLGSSLRGRECNSQLYSQLGQYLTHAYSHITLAVAAVDSCPLSSFLPRDRRREDTGNEVVECLLRGL